jgi:hypothetical protein
MHRRRQGKLGRRTRRRRLRRRRRRRKREDENEEDEDEEDEEGEGEDEQTNRRANTMRTLCEHYANLDAPRLGAVAEEIGRVRRWRSSLRDSNPPQLSTYAILHEVERGELLRSSTKCRVRRNFQRTIDKKFAHGEEYYIGNPLIVGGRMREVVISMRGGGECGVSVE